MTTRMPFDPKSDDEKTSFDQLLAEVIALRNDKFALKTVLETSRAENERLKKLLDEALTELSRWKLECLERRKLMVKAQNESLVRVPFAGTIGK